jgi:hypothetical protein
MKLIITTVWEYYGLVRPRWMVAYEKRKGWLK